MSEKQTAAGAAKKPTSLSNRPRRDRNRHKSYQVVPHSAEGKEAARAARACAPYDLLLGHLEPILRIHQTQIHDQRCLDCYIRRGGRWGAVSTEDALGLYHRTFEEIFGDDPNCSYLRTVTWNQFLDNGELSRAFNDDLIAFANAVYSKSSGARVDAGADNVLEYVPVNVDASMTLEENMPGVIAALAAGMPRERQLTFLQLAVDALPGREPIDGAPDYTDGLAALGLL